MNISTQHDFKFESELFKVARTKESQPSLPHNLLAQASVFGVTQDLVDQSLSKVSRPDLAQYLQDLMCNDSELKRITSRSYKHPNGFYKLQLLEQGFSKVRLHYWPIDMLSAEENVHNHRWRLASKVMHGTLRSELFKPVSAQLSGEADCEQLSLRLYQENLGAVEAAASTHGDRWVQKIATVLRSTGKAYFMDTDQLHRIVHEGGQSIVTLMVQSAPLFQENYMLSKKSVRSPELAPVMLSDINELKSILSKIINLLNQ
jgi:hypothetical protein